MVAAVFALVGAMLLWGGAFIAMKVAVCAYGPVFTVFARMAVGSAVFLVLFPTIRTSVRKRDVPAMLCMALCEPCLYYLFEGNAMVYTSAAQAGMVTAVLPLMVAVAAGIFLKERLGPRTWAGLCAAGAGVALLSTSAVAGESAPNPVLGNLLEVLAMVCATGYMVILKSLTPRYSPWFLTAVQSFVGLVFFTPMLLLPGVSLPSTLEAAPVASVLYLGIMATIGAYGLYNFGMSRMPAGKASGYVNLIPVVAALLGWLVLDETFTLTQIYASALVFSGVFLSQAGRIR